MWVGSGMEGLEGLDAGDVVTADHMQSLFGSGHHPLATQRSKELDLSIGREGVDRPTEADYKTARQLGTPYKVYENDISPFRIEVAKRIATINRPPACRVTGRSPRPIGPRSAPRSAPSSSVLSTAANPPTPASWPPRSPSTPARRPTPWPATT